MRILLAIDGSSFSDAAVNEVALRPWPLASELRIISVVEPPLLPTVETWVPPDNYYEALEAAAEDQARATVEKATEAIGRAQGDHLKVTAEIISGHPRHVIVDEAEQWEADLIVVGSHGYTGLTRLWLGSVSQAVASHAKCSVEIVRSKKNGNRAKY
jgi:nucleotide-binding universal stress UspA family protein